jgi:hypothetical protein
MSTSRTMIGLAAAFTFVGLNVSVFAAGNQTAPGAFRIAMDDMKSMQPGSPGPSGMGMNQKGQAQPMARDQMMMDNQMKSQQPPAMQNPDSSSQSMGGMMMMMDKMMKGHMGGMSGMAGTSTMPGTGDVTDRIEGRIAFLKTELAITEKQLADWNVLADALRSGRQHLVEARKLLVVDSKANSADRLERYERHLTERLEAIKAARAAFTRLYPNLDSAQQQTADEIVLPLIAAF